jgi:hypothetical protein
MAGEAALKGAVSGLVKDGYTALRSRVAAWAGGDVEALEKAPESPARRAVAEAIDSRPADEQEAARALARQLIAALKDAGGAPVGLDIGSLDALAVELGNIAVSAGTGVRIGDARVNGSFKAGDITVGPSTAKK